MDSRTVRELGGEIWAELQMRMQQGDEQFSQLDYQTLDLVIDLAMAVLARHTGEEIVNDEDLPVTPLPNDYPRT